MKKNGQKAKSAWCKKAVEAIQKNYRSVLVILGFFLLWEFSVVWFKVPEFVLPPPSAALKHLFIKQADANYNWPLHIRTTLQEFILGFCVTAVLGIGLAIIFVWSKKVKDMVLPLFTFINSLPIIAIAPLILLWMGYGRAVYFFRTEDMFHDEHRGGDRRRIHRFRSRVGLYHHQCAIHDEHSPHFLFIDRHLIGRCGTVLGGSVGRASYNAMGIQKGAKRLKKS